MKKKTPVKKGRVTIDSLALMVQRGFSDMHVQFEEQRVDFDDFKKSTGRSLFELHSQMASVNQRLGNIEKVLGPLVHVVDALKTNSRDHEIRITRLERN